METTAITILIVVQSIAITAGLYLSHKYTEEASYEFYSGPGPVVYLP